MKKSKEFAKIYGQTVTFVSWAICCYLRLIFKRKIKPGRRWDGPANSKEEIIN
jgi:hypothetical protein